MSDNALLKIVREEPEACHIVLTIEVPVEQVKSAFDKAMRGFTNYAKIPGFRPGKMPKDLLLRHHGKRIREEAERELMQHATEAAIAQEKLRPETSPRPLTAGKSDFNETQPYSFRIGFDVIPEFPVPQYKGLKIQRPASTVNDELVSRFISERLERRATHEKVDRPAQAGDLLKVSYNGQLVETDVTIPEYAKTLLEAQDVYCPLKKPELIPGTSDALIGASAGDERIFQVTFPEGFQVTELVGKHINYSYRVHEVQASQVPELTDDVAKQMGANTADEVKERARSILAAQEFQMQTESVRTQISDILLQSPDFPIPANLLHHETYQAFQALADRAMRAGKTEQDIISEQTNMLETARKNAQTSLKRYYILRAIAQQENIKVNQDDISQAIDSISQYQRLSPKVTARRLQESGRIGDLYTQILEGKTIEHLATLVEVVE